MIIDAHCHAWQVWPYAPDVPDPAGRASVDALLWEMDRWGIDQALLVCARIENNPGNNDYGAAAARRHPDRILQVADVDCCWAPTYHQPGAAARLRLAAEQYPLVGFTHYLAEPDGWTDTDEGAEFFAAAAELHLIASVACGPAWQPALRRVAKRFPGLQILCHHLGGLRVGSSVTELLASASVPNIALKVSGFHYASSPADWDFPYTAAQQQFRPVAEAFGPRRLCWGSDFPACRDMLTYRQSLEMVRTYCDFFSTDDKDWVLGGSVHRMLADQTKETP